MGDKTGFLRLGHNCLLTGNQLMSHLYTKKEKEQTLQYYRPISLTSVCCKTLEHIVYSSIFSHLENHQILTDNQHGFCTRPSCGTRLISAISDFQQCLNNKKHIDAIFLNFAKAFDKVSNTKLCHKLSPYGINGNFYHGSRTTYLIDLNL